jgi:hypothetical protein
MNIEKLKVLEIITGSNLYGTATPSSDKDYVGIFIPPIEYYLGLHKIEEQDCSIVSKHKNGRNTLNAIDRKFYEIKKYFKLALNSNPNILELLFAPKDKIIYVDKMGQSILDNRDLFTSQLCKKSFLGYASSQKHKMIIKADNLIALENGLGFLSLFPDKATLSEVLNKEIELFQDPLDYQPLPFINHSSSHIKCGDVCFERNLYVKKAKRIIRDRLQQASWRSEGILKHGMDNKFGSHLIRLLYECKELLEDGKITFPLKERSLILDIKEGKYKPKEVINLAEELEKEIALCKTDLPKIGNFNKAEELLLDILQTKFIRGNNEI